MLSVSIIDDEPHAQEALRAMLTELCPDVRILGEANGVASGIQLIEEMRPDAIFLDIKMNDGTGFDLLKHFPNPAFNIIFTTAYEEYALDAIKCNALDYLVKAINPDELVAAIDKLREKEQGVNQRLLSLMASLNNKEEEKIALSSSEGWSFWKLKNIMRLESSSNMTTFFNVSGDKLMVSRTLKEFENILPKGRFFRTHQSHMVNRHYVSQVLREDGGYALLPGNTKIPVSRRKLNAFFGWLREGGL